MADIFLSYARADQPRVEQLAASLEKAGYTIWWDRHLEGGGQYSKDIEAQLDSASAVIVAWSETSVESEWVRDEAATARDADKLVPIALDDTLPPLGFRQRQAIDLSGKADQETSLASLHAVLDKMIGSEHDDIAPVKSPTKLPKMALLSIPLLLLVAAAAWYFTQYMGGDDSALSADGRDSIAILPFVAQSSDEDDQYFADGVTEEILNRLDAVEELRVLPRTTVFSLRDNEDALNVLADQLKVDYIVEGSLRRGGDNVRVTARLIRASDDETLWSNSYDGSRDDVLQFQSDIAEKVAASLDVLLDEEVLARMEAAGVNDPEAFAIYAQASALDNPAHTDLADLSGLYKVSQLYDEAFAASPKLWSAAINASDFYSHLITDGFASEASADIPPEFLADPSTPMQTRLARAREAAPTRQDRLSIDLYAKAFTNDWSDIPQLSQTYYGNFEGCELPNWAGFLIDSIGQSEGLARAYLAAEKCRAGERLYSNFTVDTLGKAGMFEEARAFVERERERGIRPERFYFVSYSAIEHYEGNLDKAIEYARQRGTEDPRDAMALALLEGSEDAVAKVDAMLDQRGFPQWGVLSLYARSGQRERANALAAIMDARPGGPTALQIATDFCTCGSPFDIENTPNYAATLERSGIDWPFKSPLKWPLKDW